MKKLYLFILFGFTALFASAQSSSPLGNDAVVASSYGLSRAQLASSSLVRLKRQSAMLAAVYRGYRLRDSSVMFSGSLLSASVSRSGLSAFNAALTQGAGILPFTYDGTTATTVALDQTFSPTWTGKHKFNNSVTASSGLAQALAFTPTLTAAANNDVLAVMDVTPTFTNGSFTGVTNAILRGTYAGLGQSTVDAFILRNPTPSTSSVQQYTPAITWTSSSWNTASNISEPISYRAYVTTNSGSYLSNGNFTIAVSQNGGPYVYDMSLDPYGNLTLGSACWTYAGAAAASKDGLVLSTGANATSSSPSIWSGRVRLDGYGWNTTTSASQSTDFIMENKPVSGATLTSKLVISSRIGTGAYVENFAIGNNGLWSLNGTALTGTQLVGANASGSGMEAKTISSLSGTGLTVTNTPGTITFANDTTSTLQTIANFFPKGDTRYLRGNGTAGGDLAGTLPNPTVAKFNGQLPSYYLNYTNLTNTPSKVSAFTNDAGYLTSVTSAQLTAALGYTPYNGTTNPNNYLTGVTGSQVTTALGYTPYNGSTNPNGYLTSVTGAQINAALGYTAYNGDSNPKGYLTGITSSQVNTALGFTPYNGSTNPNGYLTAVTSTQINSALGYTPYNGSTNPNNYLTGITGSQVTTALGFTPYNGSTNPNGYLTGVTNTQIKAALGYTPYNGDSNPAGYLTGVSNAQVTSALGYTPYNGSTNPNGYLTAVTGAQINSALGYTAYNGDSNPAGYLTSVSNAQVTSALGYTPYNGSTNPNGYLTSVSGTQVTSALGYTAADNSAVVHLAGAESITGLKTFTGNVSFGATTIPTGYQYAFNGNTIASSITIRAYSKWADYVFSPQYKLLSLSEVAEYIRVNHHLQDIPTAAEVEKNGQNLGEMNEKLLKKVEELTLYLIEKDKQIKDQKAVIESQEERLRKIEARLDISR